MKRILSILVLCIVLFCFWGCASGYDSRLQVCVMDAQGVSIAENGLLVSPGSDATFVMELPTDFDLASTDYPGEYQIYKSGQSVTLTLYDIRYPTRVQLQLVSRQYSVIYHANGGSSIKNGTQEETVSYSLRYHARPNTSIGTDLFHREGCTLACWNTEPDGSGTRVGLGSRVTLLSGEPLHLYAQWIPWSNAEDFSVAPVEAGIMITGYHGFDETVVIPEIIDGLPVVGITSGAFMGCTADSIVFPKTLRDVETGAFQRCSMRSLTLFDNMESIHDDGFVQCENLQTLYINAIEAPYGYKFRRESVYADKVDLLILAQGRQKMVFYGGCSMWYNLDGPAMQQALGEEYQVINLALNGTVSSLVQMQILEKYMEPGDILFHTPELSSKTQLFLVRNMRPQDENLWCGLEYNYDLFALVDIRQLGGVFDSLTHYLSKKTEESSYLDYYEDSVSNQYMDKTGSIPFFREQTHNDLQDDVFLNPDYFAPGNMGFLQERYHALQTKSVRIYVSYACVNMDAVPESQKNNVTAIDVLFRTAIGEMGGPVLISRLEDFLYQQDDFYDTNYHLLTEQTSQNTALWIRDLMEQMEKDGLSSGKPLTQNLRE